MREEIKKISSGLAVFLILGSSLLGFLIIGPGDAKAEPVLKTMAVDITVPTDYPTIQMAVDNANPGNTIFILGGAYFENVSIQKRLYFLSDNTSIYMHGNITVGASGHVDMEYMKFVFNCTYDGHYTLKNNGILNVSCCNISAPEREMGFAFVLNSETVVDNSTILNLWQNHAANWWRKRGIEVYDDDVLIKDCYIGSDYRNLSNAIGMGIFIDHAAPHIINTTFENFDRMGIDIDYCHTPVIEHCTFKNCFQGIYGHRESSYISKNNTFINISWDPLTCETNVDAIIENTTFIDCDSYYELLSGNVIVKNSTASGRSNITTYWEIKVGNNCYTTCTNCYFGWDNITMGTTNSELILRNYLDIYVEQSEGIPLSGADVKVLDNNDVL